MDKITFIAGQVLKAAELNTLQDNVETAINEGSVTSEEKASWNAKQDALTAGTGISIENGVISVNITSAEGVSF